MYVCMYVYMYVCMYVCMYVYMYVCMYGCTYVCMYVSNTFLSSSVNLFVLLANVYMCTYVVWNAEQSTLQCLSEVCHLL